MESEDYDSEIEEDESVCFGKGGGGHVSDHVAASESDDECQSMRMVVAEDESREEDEGIVQNVLDKAYLQRLQTFNIKTTGNYDDDFDMEEEAGSTSDSMMIAFILMDIDVVVDKIHGTSVALFGRASPTNQSIVVHLSGWYASLCMKEPHGWNHDLHVDSLKWHLTQALISRIENGHPHLLKTFHSIHCQPIVSIDQKVGTNVMGYHPDAQSKPFLKINVACASFIPLLREYLEGGYHPTEEGSRLGDETPKATGVSFVVLDDKISTSPASGHTPTYNSNFEPILQFMVDRGISGCQWCQVPSRFVHPLTRKSNCDIEMQSCSVDDLQLMSLEERSDAGSIRILSFDLEAAGRKGVFPDPAIDPVIQIGIQFQTCGFSLSEHQERGPKPILLSFKECHDIEGADVFSFESEANMLKAFRDIMIHFDPDIITGYNICNFDTDYLKKRAEALEIGREFCSMTRIKLQRLNVREVVFQSAQVGKRKSNKVTIKGRAVLDVYKWMKDNFNLEEYSLNAVCAKFLGDSKEDIHFTEITPKWNQGPATRKELGIYCLKDALLPLHLLDKLNITLNAIERARVTGLPCEWVLNRGMLVRFTSQLMRESADQGYVLPFIGHDSPLRNEASKYAGATVLNVERGLWTNVAVLDFSSMYPCQIIAENLCYSTYLGQHSWPQYSLTTKPLYFQGHKFVSDNDRKGIIPCILERMLKQRKIAKAAFAAETQDPVKKMVLKARELSYKVVCNGIYGALGCRNALIPLRAIAETTTGLGRKDIQKVKEIAEDMFTTFNGFVGNAKVVCGDTDSVFVSMPIPEELQGLDAIAESMKYANRLADAVNSIMKKPKKIEPEKVFANLLLMKKKRYAGLKYENLEDEPKIDIKGIECVRRDGCLLVRNAVRETVECLARTADVEAAAQLVRTTVAKIMADEIPNDDYAIKKMLRKSIQDCSHPMTPHEIVNIRKAIQSDKTAAQLTEAEQDEAIRLNIRLPWRIFRKLPHIMVAWKLRLKDPGSAPVMGEAVRYIISLNGGKMVSEKAEPLEFAAKGAVIVDRHFYLKSFRKAMDGIFTPIVEQRHNGSMMITKDASEKMMSKDHAKKREKILTDTFNNTVKREVESLIWKQLLEGTLTRSKDKQKAMIQQSPIMQAFMRAASKKQKVPSS